MAGVDVAWRVRQELKQFSKPGDRKPLVADTLCEMGRFGQKTGKGWYVYGDDRKPTPDPEVLALIERASAAAGITRRPIGTDEIIERTQCFLHRSNTIKSMHVVDVNVVSLQAT